ncbi:immunity 22 family protein [Lentibacillus sp. Marseille-P4043]|uniref:immunity 22 family protein n=1 Tax=Lentibacillus sp. Marseille-P4043 TaxID=2040293 RepID=UPI001F3D0FEF|nr:immunity 22 family protein [Lentibacillus sp. Marseille-P4043]
MIHQLTTKYLIEDLIIGLETRRWHFIFAKRIKIRIGVCIANGKKGIVSIWLGNVKEEYDLKEYVDLKYDEEGESIPSKFYVDFNIDMDETDEDFIEKAVLVQKSNNISDLLEGCSYDEIILPKISESVNLNKYYNAVH